MKIRSVAVEGVGRFGALARMQGLGPGVNILSACNEAGKSTMFRAIRACLFERHTATNKDVRALATDGLSLPVRVTLEFDHANNSYELAKSFLKSPSASLKCNNVVKALDATADEEVWELLGIKQESSRSVDDAAFGILWVGQGQSFIVPQPSEAAASALNDVIQQEVGTLVGGERARKLLGEVKDELGKLVTDTKKPRKDGPYANALNQVEAISRELADAENRLTELDHSLDTLARLHVELKNIADPAATERLQRQQLDAEQQLQQAEAAAKELQRFVHDESQSRALFEAQEQKLLELRQRCQRIDQNHSRITSLKGSILALDEDETTAGHTLAEALSRKAEIDRRSGELDDDETRLQRLALTAQNAASRDALASRLTSLQSFTSRIIANEAALKANSVDEAALATLAKIEGDIEKLSARIESAAARITVESKPGAEVRINGQALEGNMVRAVTEPMTVTVGDQVAITVSPPASSLAAAETERHQQQSKLKELFILHNVAGSAELRRIRNARTEFEEGARILKAELQLFALRISPAAEIERLSAAIAGIDTACERVLAETAAASLPPLDEIEAERSALQAARTELKNARAGWESIIAGQNDILSRIGSQRAGLAAEMREIERQLETDIVALPASRRDEIIAECERQREAKRTDLDGRAALLAAKRRDAPDADKIDQLRIRAERFRAANKRHVEDIAALKLRIAELEGQVKAAGGDGLGEKLAGLVVQNEMARAELSRQETRLATLRLLRDEVENSYQKRRGQLQAPLRRHLKPFLQDVFPLAEIELGEDFSIAGLRRQGPASELFGRLSAGTQEQVAVLVRLAMGAMICERGPEVPIILDDALVFSDDARIDQMFDAINRAGRNQQVIVFTCRARSFAGLGGQPIYIA